MPTIESILHESRLFPPNSDFTQQANISGSKAYRELCAQAENNHQEFWANQAKKYILWHKPFTKILDDTNPPFFQWFNDGELNVSYNCLDRHLAEQPDKTAIIFESDDGDVIHATYRDLHQHVCKFANALKALNIGKGDCVIIYMPMRIEAVVAMQACARIGAIHSVVFGGFSSKSLHERITNAGAKAIITADEQVRGGKRHALKATVDEAISMGGTESVKTVIVCQRSGSDIPFDPARDVWWHDITQNANN